MLDHVTYPAATAATNTVAATHLIQIQREIALLRWHTTFTRVAQGSLTESRTQFSLVATRENEQTRAAKIGCLAAGY